MTESLTEVAGALRAVIGASLERVEYGLLPSDKFDPSSVELGGEVVLTWMGEKKVHFTWGGRPGAKQDWVLRATAANLLSPVPPATDVSSSDLWASLIGSELVESEILGWVGEPSVARLRFSAGSILVGVGAEGWFGSADSIMVRPDSSPFLDFPMPIQTMWASSHVA